MPRERFPADDPREWMVRAESNLAQAKARAPGVCLEDLCFNAQQSVEKALKALLLRRRGQFPYTHDIAELLRLLGDAGAEIPDDLGKLKTLTDYAVETRYPGPFDPVTEEDYREALDLALRCVEWVRQALAGAGAHEA